MIRYHPAWRGKKAGEKRKKMAVLEIRLQMTGMIRYHPRSSCFVRKEGRDNGKKIAVGLKKTTDQTSHTPRYLKIAD